MSTSLSSPRTAASLRRSLTAGIAAGGVLAASAATAFAQGPTKGPVRHDNLPANDILSVVRQRALIPDAQFGPLANGPVSSIAFRGTNIGLADQTWIPIGPDGFTTTGRVNAVAYDPKVPIVAYAATANGGVFKTADNFATWIPLSREWPTLQTSSIAIDPVNNRVLYAGLGDFDGAQARFDERRLNRPGVGTGIMKSVNGGNTWVNIAQTEMAGTQVSRIAIQGAEAPQTLVVATGRRTFGANASLWLSTDGGTTWTNVTPGGLTGDWSDVEFSQPFQEGGVTKRWAYATLHGVGVFRAKSDSLANWTKLPAPLIYNNAANTGGIQFPGASGIEVATSPLSSGIVYVMDGSGNVGSGLQAGRIFASADAGNTWTDITGNFPTIETIQGNISNNWGTIQNGAALTALLSGQQGGPVQDLLFGGAALLTGSLPTTNPLIWSGGVQPNNIIHDMAADPFVRGATPGALTQALVATDSGTYEMTYQPNAGTAFGAVSYNSFTSFNLDNEEFLFATFDPSNINRIFGRTTVGHRRAVSGTDTDANWNTGPGFLFFDNGGGAIFDPDPDANTTSPQVPPISKNILRVNVQFENIGGIAFDRSNLGADSTRIQYAVTRDNNTDLTQIIWSHNGSVGRSGRRRVFMTRDRWATAIDITPDRYLVANGAMVVTDPANPQPQYVYNSQADASVASDWQGEPKPDWTAITVDESTGRMYLGTRYLWVFEPPTARPPDGIGGTGSVGFWRRIDTQLAANGFITAIAVRGSRAYVGTSEGELWMTEAVRDFDPANITNWRGNPRQWQSLNVASLPSQAATSPSGVASRITDIDINPNNVGDILVTLGGPGSTGVYRLPNATATDLLFTPANGNGPRTLPAAPVNGIVRDPADTQDTWFVATDMGVFTTTNGGFDWYDATNGVTQQDLPDNVKAIAIDVSENPADNSDWLQIATHGRGVWRFPLSTVQEVTNLANITTRFALSRSGSLIYATAQLTNFDVNQTVGVATNVRITSATLTPLGAATLNTSTALPTGAVTLGIGETKNLTVRFPAGTVRRGALATIQLTITYTDSDGTTKTLTPSIRTRMP